MKTTEPSIIDKLATDGYIQIDHSWRCNYPEVYGECACEKVANLAFKGALAAHDAELLARVRAEIETATTVGWSSFDDGEPLIRTRDALAVLDRLGEQQ